MAEEASAAVGKKEEEEKEDEQEQKQKQSLYVRVISSKEGENGLEWFKADGFEGVEKALVSKVCGGKTWLRRGLRGDKSVMLGSVLYVLGGLCGCPLSTCGHPSNYGYLFVPHPVSDVIKFDTLRPDDGWRSVSPMRSPRGMPYCVALDGRIFAFGGEPRDEHFAEVYDPEIDTWEPLPVPHGLPDWLSCGVSYPVLADTSIVGSRGRILAYFLAVDSLYAFHLDDNSWTCIDQNFGQMPKSAILVDDVIYCYPGYEFANHPLLAYNLTSRKWLTPPDWSPRDLSDLFGGEGTYDDLLYLGDGVFALTFFSYEFQENGGKTMFVHFAKFTLGKASDSDSGTLVATPCSFIQSFKVNAGVSVEDFVFPTR